MAQQASKYQCCFQAQLFHFWFSFPVNAPGRTTSDGSDTNVGDKDTAPGKAPGAEANMEVNQWIAPPTYHSAISTNQSGKRENSERNCQLYCLIHNLNSRNNINISVSQLWDLQAWLPQQRFSAGDDYTPSSQETSGQCLQTTSGEVPLAFDRKKQMFINTL